MQFLISVEGRCGEWRVSTLEKEIRNLDVAEKIAEEIPRLI